MTENVLKGRFNVYVGVLGLGLTSLVLVNGVIIYGYVDSVSIIFASIFLIASALLLSLEYWESRSPVKKRF